MARKQNQGAPVERIDSSPRFATAAAILHTLEEGLRAIERESDALRLEDYLGRSRLKADPRSGELRQRLKTLRESARTTQAPPVDTELPPPVKAALELLRAGVRPARRDLAALLEQLEDDKAVVREAICAQHAIVEAIRGDLSADVARDVRTAHRELVLTQYRAAQQFAAAIDAERELRRSITGAGYTWRDDLLPAPTMRAALILGSEAEFDSEISRVRRMLEEWKVL
ncbi:MAG: hypothetical protein WAU56_07500 [Steroidobacteraceae bacterium]